MTGILILLKSQQWRDLTSVKLESFFYAAMLWGGDPMRIVEDATRMRQRPGS